MSDTSPSLLDQMMFVVRGDTVLQETASGRRVPRVGSLALADGETKTIAVEGEADTNARVVSVAAPGGADVTSALELLSAGALDGDLVSLRVTVQSAGLCTVHTGDPGDPLLLISADGADARIETVDFRFVGDNWILWHHTVIATGEVT